MNPFASTVRSLRSYHITAAVCPPPEDLQSLGMHKGSYGIYHSDNDDPRGWAGIKEKHGAELALLTDTGCEPKNKAVAAQIPAVWDSWRCMWFNPAALLPPTCISRSSKQITETSFRRTVILPTTK